VLCISYHGILPFSFKAALCNSTSIDLCSQFALSESHPDYYVLLLALIGWLQGKARQGKARQGKARQGITFSYVTTAYFHAFNNNQFYHFALVTLPDAT
jgi:hypothetical protein